MGRPSNAPIYELPPPVQPVKDAPTPPFSFELVDGAKYLGIPYQSLYKEVRNGEIKTKKYGVRHIVERVELERWFRDLPDSSF